MIFVNKDLATLHYFPCDDHPGFYSEGAMPGLDPDGDAVFFMNDLTEEEGFPNYKVVPFSAALVAAKESLASPNCHRRYDGSNFESRLLPIQIIGR
jgi:hypothetical protein